jgi:hypothetical protein
MVFQEVSCFPYFSAPAYRGYNYCGGTQHIDTRPIEFLPASDLILFFPAFCRSRANKKEISDSAPAAFQLRRWGPILIRGNVIGHLVKERNDRIRMTGERNLSSPKPAILQFIRLIRPVSHVERSGLHIQSFNAGPVF